MPSLQEEIDQLLSLPSMPVDKQWATRLHDQHPTFVLPLALLLKRNAKGLDYETRRDIANAVMLGCADNAAMADFADITGSFWADIYPPEPEPQHKGTVDTIDTFLETYGKSTPEDNALLEKLIFNPVVPDYFQGLDEPIDPDDSLFLPPELRPAQQQDLPQPEEEAPLAQQQTTPATTPQAAPQPKPDAEAGAKTTQPAKPTKKETAEPSTSPKTREEPSLMESLAKIFIKQRRYERAFEIISNLSLKNPEKSAYFADQLRFLQKLINNQRFLQKNIGDK